MHPLTVFKFFENLSDNTEFLNIPSNNYIVAGHW